METIRKKHHIFNADLRQKIADNLANFSVVAHDNAEMKQASVALTIVNIARDPELYDIPYEAGWENHAAIILTERARGLNKHAGQWALPGGRMDEGETPEQTALRELEEEVGVSLAPDCILGRLDDFTTRSGFTMKCVVVWGGDDITLVPNPAEVAAAHRIPLAEFMRDDSPILRDTTAGPNPILILPIGSSWIAAPTGALLYQFREVAILGKQTRVAHFDQPRFTWK